MAGVLPHNTSSRRDAVVPTHLMPNPRKHILVRAHTDASYSSSIAGECHAGSGKQENAQLIRGLDAKGLLLLIRPSGTCLVLCESQAAAKRHLPVTTLSKYIAKFDAMVTEYARKFLRVSSERMGGLAKFTDDYRS